MHSVITLNAKEKAILPGINFAGPLGNIAQLQHAADTKILHQPDALTVNSNPPRTHMNHQSATKQGQNQKHF